MFADQQSNGRVAVNQDVTPRELLDFYLREHPHDVALALTVMCMELSARMARLEAALEKLQSRK